MAETQPTCEDTQEIMLTDVLEFELSSTPRPDVAETAQPQLDSPNAVEIPTRTSRWLRLARGAGKFTSKTVDVVFTGLSLISGDAETWNNL